MILFYLANDIYSLFLAFLDAGVDTPPPDLRLFEDCVLRNFLGLSLLGVVPGGFLYCHQPSGLLWTCLRSTYTFPFSLTSTVSFSLHRQKGSPK